MNRKEKRSPFLGGIGFVLELCGQPDEKFREFASLCASATFGTAEGESCNSIAVVAHIDRIKMQYAIIQNAFRLGLAEDDLEILDVHGNPVMFQGLSASFEGETSYANVDIGSIRDKRPSGCTIWIEEPGETISCRMADTAGDVRKTIVKRKLGFVAIGSPLCHCNGPKDYHSLEEVCCRLAIDEHVGFIIGNL